MRSKHEKSDRHRENIKRYAQRKSREKLNQEKKDKEMRDQIFELEMVQNNLIFHIEIS